MNADTRRGLLVAGLAANILFLALVLIDYSLDDAKYVWPIFIGWAFLIVLVVLLALLSEASPAAMAAAPVQAMQPVLASPVAAPLALPVAVMAPAAPAPSPPVLAFTEEAFPFTYNGYTLYTRQVELKGGGQRRIWFFSKRKPSSGQMAAKPAGFHVGVNGRTGLPFLKKGVGRDGEDLTPDVEHALRPQCAALTEDSKQCRNSARHDSKYCASHFGYQPPQIAKAEAARKDTLARVKGARDTLPSVRRKPKA